MPEPSRHEGELPAHPERVDPAMQAAEGRRWGGGVVVVVLLGASVVVLVAVHLTGIAGPGAY